MADLETPLVPVQAAGLATKLAPRTELRMAGVAPAPAVPRTAVLRLLLVAVLGLGLAVPVLLRPSEVGGVEVDALADAAAPLRDSVALRSAGAAVADAAELPPPVASVPGLVLVAPSDRVRIVGFHEASYPDALALEPQGSNQANDNTTKFTDPGATDGHPFVVLSSRGRRTAATSALDIAVDPGIPIRSMVEGTVVAVDAYHLYGRYQDTRIEIAPAARPDLRVVIIHVTDPQVAPGARVVAGETVIAGAANHFPFRSHIDRYVEGTPGPHVHIEVKKSAER